MTTSALASTPPEPLFAALELTTAAGDLATEPLAADASPAETCAALRTNADDALGEKGRLLLRFDSPRSDEELAAWRDALWPWLHVVAVVTGDARRTLQGSQRVPGLEHSGSALVAVRSAYALSPDATVEKFDQNAAGWNGVPGGPGYGHFRWMRRFVAHFAPPVQHARILDFGSGAGWVGIEAALRGPGNALRFFDPSPEMVRIAADNARAEGLTDAEGRVGFGEDPPFPAAGEERFDLVLSSGVVSFSPDAERWLDGLQRTLAPGATLVIGDIHRDSRGMRTRRARKPLLPVREMNAKTRDEMRALLEARGFRLEAAAGYQMTWPIPQAVWFSEARLKGALDLPLLALNRLSTKLQGPSSQDRFDSWVMRLRAP